MSQTLFNTEHLLQCCNDLARSTSPQTSLSLFTQFLGRYFEDLEVLVLSSTSSANEGVYLIAHVDGHGNTFESFDGLVIDEQNKPFNNNSSLLALLEHSEFNQSQTSQQQFCEHWHGELSADKIVQRFGAPTLDDQRIYCVIACRDTQNNCQSLEQSQASLQLLVNLLLTFLVQCQQRVQLEREKEWVQAELKQIAHVQKLLLPQGDPGIKGAEIAANFRPCVHAGGDYYDIVNLTEAYGFDTSNLESDFWGVMIADSAGHGAAAAVEISMYDAILRTFQLPEGEDFDGPARVFDYTNQYLFTRLIRGTFITAFAIGYHPVDDRLRYACAGHPPPLLYRAAETQVIQLNEAAGIPLGVTRDFNWQNASTEFRQNDIHILYTDGILEAENRHGEQFGLERLTELLRHNHSLGADSLLNLIEQTIDNFQAHRGRKDDQTIVVVKKTAP